MAEQTTRPLRFIKIDKSKLPQFKMAKRGNWVEYGSDNNYPDFLVNLYMRSSQHAAIVNGKVKYISGKGWTIDDRGISIEQKAKAQAFINKPNPYETLEILTNKAATDFELSNLFYFEVVWRPGGTRFDIYHLPFVSVRSNPDNTVFYIKKDWNDTREKPRVLPAFDPKNPTGKQVYMFKADKPLPSGFETAYTYPEYQACVPWIEVDYEIANFHKRNIQQGFSAGTIITFTNGIPTDEAAAMLERQVKDALTGTENAGDIVIQFADDKDKVPQITRLSGGDLDKQFETLKPLVQESIFIGHSVTDPELFGVKSSGNRLGRSEKREAYEQFQNTYVTPRQQMIEYCINHLAKYNGVPEGLKIVQVEPIGMEFSEAVLTAYLTPEEVGKMIRERLGLPEPERQQQFAKEERGSLVSEHIEVFKKYGRKKDKYKRLAVRNLNFTDQTQLQIQEYVLRQTYAAKNYRMNELQKAIVNILANDPDQTIDQIAVALKKPIDQVRRDADKLVAEEILKRSNRQYGVTKAGLDTLNAQQPNISIEVLYEYAVASGMGPTLLKTSRDFCVELIQADLLYSREDINRISAEVGYDVWAFRGGWYTNPKDGFSYPACRHIWRQVVVTNQ